MMLIRLHLHYTGIVIFTKTGEAVVGFIAVNVFLHS